MVNPQPAKRDKTYPDTRYFAHRISQCGHQPVYKQLLPDGEPTVLPILPGQKLYDHSPGFGWGSSTARRIRGKVSETFLDGQFSYKFGGNLDNAFASHWNFMEIKDIMIENADMDDVKRHSKLSGKSYLVWDISIEFDGGIHQYSFAIKSSDKINEKLITISREISNLSEPLSRQVLIPSNYFGKSPSLFTILNIVPIASCSPHFPLETEPIPLHPKVLILSPPIITNLATKGMLIGTPCFTINSIEQSFNNYLSTKETSDTLWHIILLTFYLYYITSNPNKTSGSLGSAQLALALLLDVTSDPNLALAYYQQFKCDVVANWGDEWTIFSGEILLWIEAQKIRELGIRASKN